MSINILTSIPYSNIFCTFCNFTLYYWTPLLALICTLDIPRFGHIHAKILWVHNVTTHVVVLYKHAHRLIVCIWNVAIESQLSTRSIIKLCLKLAWPFVLIGGKSIITIVHTEHWLGVLLLEVPGSNCGWRLASLTWGF
jgi:hypothetical protein